MRICESLFKLNLFAYKNKNSSFLGENGVAQDGINFESRRSIKAKYDRLRSLKKHAASASYRHVLGVEELKLLSDAPCVYCGKKMIPGKFVGLIEYSGNGKINPNQYTDKLIRLIDPYKDALMPVEKYVFDKIQYFHKKDPKLCLQDIINILNRNFTSINHQKQNLLDDIKIVALKYFDVQNTNAMTSDEASEIGKKLFKNIRIFLNKYANDKKINTISSKNIIRSNERIAKKIITPSITSIEHLKPQMTFSEIDILEKDKLSNLVLAHAHCNSERQSIPLNVFAEKNKSVIAHVKEYIYFVKKAFSNENLQSDIKSYPYDISRTFCEQSNGVIDIVC